MMGLAMKLNRASRICQSATPLRPPALPPLHPALHCRFFSETNNTNNRFVANPLPKKSGSESYDGKGRGKPQDFSSQMSIYMSRLFPRSNSSFHLSSGNALQSEVLRLRKEMFLVDTGIGTPRICMHDELTGVPINRATTRFENKVGFLDPVAGESPIKGQILERFFIDLVAGDSVMKERAAAKFNDLVGSTDVVAGEPLLLPPRKFRQNRAWMELNKIWRTNTKVKGFVFRRVRGGYLVAIAGYFAFLPLRRRPARWISNDRFTIESINSKKMNMVVC
ncbi:hypothetical protein ACH5RR_004881 [Cinchona calisaya]|uniref:Ribosomal protein S1 n=1 Tax=Cinchona calisaya TaxID=153742 RepID=A0ABD3AZ96_9GENT